MGVCIPCALYVLNVIDGAKAGRGGKPEICVAICLGCLRVASLFAGTCLVFSFGFSLIRAVIGSDLNTGRRLGRRVRHSVVVSIGSDLNIGRRLGRCVCQSVVFGVGGDRSGIVRHHEDLVTLAHVRSIENL